MDSLDKISAEYSPSWLHLQSWTVTPWDCSNAPGGMGGWNLPDVLCFKDAARKVKLKEGIYRKSVFAMGVTA